ncbi:hypothetical protein [Sphingomonas colocasiae]|uniref:Uncharacterized protein n=1 Tax=Sphingomonas colocasiae TaxID=1848973 RepID=A0ABS7PUS9_9SPHN|nr:hypothetical protein [Sphingomonas colocasiae]MBY8825099.1 hypothetical protein [Sphingomonas colocasiae]
MARMMFFAIAFFYAVSSVHTVAVSQPILAPPEFERSLVIVRVDRFQFQPDETVSFPNKPDDFFLGGVYRANSTALKTLSGPSIKGPVEISLAGLHIDRWRNVKLLMVIRKDEAGRLWAGQQWERITDKICLSDDEIRTWQIEPLFASAKRRDDGFQCIRS